MKTFLSLLVSVITLHIHSAAFAATAETTGTSSFGIFTPLALTEVTPLSFGTIVAGPSGGTTDVTPVVIPGGGISGIATPTITLINGATTGDIELLALGTAASFSVVGMPGDAVFYDVTPTITLTGPGTPMTATLVTASLSYLDAAGTGSTFVAGRLSVGPAQAEGTYTGTYVLTADY